MTSASPVVAANLPPPPRPVEWVNTKAKVAIWIPRLFVVPHALVGVGLVGVMLGAVLWMLLGAPMDASVTRTWTTRAKGRPVCHMEWEYLHGGQRHAGSSTYPCARSGEVSRPGAEVPVRALHLGGLHYAALWTPLRSVGELVMFPFVFGLLWNGGMAVALWFLWGVPMRQRRLVETGSATEGTITRKYSRASTSQPWMIEYRYQPLGGAPQTGSAPVLDRPRWEAAQEGAKLVVLYDPQAPGRSVPYEYGPFRIRSAGVR